MSVKRTSIDHRLDLLSARTANAKREAMQGTVSLALISAVVAMGIWWWRASNVRRDRRLLAASVRL
jgi:hypothetical protein